VARAVAPRVASAALAAVTFILGRSTRALAASSGVPVKADPNVVKLGVGVGGAAIACVAYILSSRQAPAKAVKSAKLATRDEPPAHLDEDAMLLMDLSSRMQSLSSSVRTTPKAPPAEGSATGVREGSEQARAGGVDAALNASDIPLVDQAFLADDSLVLGALAARLRQLAETPPPELEPPAADDSTDEWSKGGTAVLEPPKPKEDPPAFPDGFPLRDFANEPLDDKPPAPSEDEIAMLKRMFGSA
jgi:hypothetical protein